MADDSVVDEGYKAGKRGAQWTGDCPYTFDKSGMTIEAYKAAGLRDKLDDWWVGWCVAREMDPGDRFRRVEQALRDRLKHA